MTPPDRPTDPLELPYAWGGPAGEAVLRAEPEDFEVEEIPVCEPEGRGEHLWLWVRKRDANTEWVARALARWADVPPTQVSYAGLKDRRAVTRQWYSLHLPGRPDPDLDSARIPGVEILAAARHPRKLRRGALGGNRFRIRLRDWQGDEGALAERLRRIAGEGVPNYFGPQRFGHGSQNLRQAERLFQGALQARRHQRGLYLSAARSWLFNQVLAQRVEEGAWNRARVDDFLLLNRRRGGFRRDAGNTGVEARLARGEIHPSGPLWGRGPSMAGPAVAEWERWRLAPWADWMVGLERAGLTMERRALRVLVEQLRCEREGAVLALSFELPAGSYATAVLRELVTCQESAAA